MIPIFLMLLAGAITSIITYIRDYELVKMLWTLLGVLIVFYALGVVIKKTLNLFDAYRLQESGFSSVKALP